MAIYRKIFPSAFNLPSLLFGNIKAFADLQLYHWLPAGTRNLCILFPFPHGRSWLQQKLQLEDPTAPDSALGSLLCSSELQLVQRHSYCVGPTTSDRHVKNLLDDAVVTKHNILFDPNESILGGCWRRCLKMWQLAMLCRRSLVNIWTMKWIEARWQNPTAMLGGTSLLGPQITCENNLKILEWTNLSLDATTVEDCTGHGKRGMGRVHKDRAYAIARFRHINMYSMGPGGSQHVACWSCKYFWHTWNQRGYTAAKWIYAQGLSCF